MDSTVVVGMAKWVVAELIRVFHDVSISEAQSTVDSLVEITVPLVWSEGDIKRVLNPKLKLKDQILMLVGSTGGKTRYSDLERWIEPKTKKYLLRSARELHDARFVEFRETEGSQQLLPPGAKALAAVMRKLSGE